MSEGAFPEHGVSQAAQCLTYLQHPPSLRRAASLEDINRHACGGWVSLQPCSVMQNYLPATEHTFDPCLLSVSPTVSLVPCPLLMSDSRVR